MILFLDIFLYLQANSYLFVANPKVTHCQNLNCDSVATGKIVVAATVLCWHQDVKASAF